MLSIEMYSIVPNGTLPENYKQCAMQGQSLNDLICNNPADSDIYYGIEGKGLVRIKASELHAPNKFSCTNYGSRTPEDAPMTLPEDIDDPDPTESKFCYSFVQPKKTNTTSSNGFPLWAIILLAVAGFMVIAFLIFYFVASHIAYSQNEIR